MAGKEQLQLSIDRRFWTFHGKHPDVYERLVALARELVKRGHQRIGIGMLWEVLRYEHLRLKTRGFSLNNDYRSRYARLIAEKEPDLAPVIQVRQLKTP
jgi:hypothetical protein